MKQYIKRLFSDSAAFAVATMGNKLVAALLVPVFTRYLHQDGQMADWGLTNSYTLILTYLCILGTDAAMAFFFFDAKDERERKIYLTNAIMFSAGICLVFTLISFFAGESLAKLIFKTNHDYSQLFTVATLATLGAIIIQHLLGYARYGRRVWLFNSFSMGYVIGSSLLSVWFVVEGQGVLGLFYGQLIGQCSVALILLIIFRKEFVFQPSGKHLGDLISYGAPLLPTLLSFWIITTISQPMVYYLSSVHDADILAVCLRLASIIVLVTSPFQLAWRPFSMSIKDREDAPQVYSLVGRALLVVGTLAIMILTFFMDPLYQIFAGRPDLASGYIYVWLLSLGTLFNVLHTVFGVGLLIKKQTKKISQSFLVAAIVYLLGNILLIPLFGLWGAVSMTVVAYLVVILFVYRQNQKIYPVDFRFGSMLIYITVYLLAMIGITWVQLNNFANQWIYYLIALMIVLLTAIASQLLPLAALNRLSALLPKLGGKR
ncbi:Membrane protein involved in the export of O-antigen and teichoic acid [Seinonella peptonophila]|uniref:Membrane protein involved in the export of O-antigen and teichoic acid n=1 Tax=Seinonella peptonophila TaxID=112248 RepID=A0A1M4XSM5_9BACL|nr:polysaccharide biosynthesis C-terminal domain-containing protein [Seinonella peptonophila]SHE96283.1 Membrane protein involved in the export of O-antigen and teichoic acid [Seinonella peptonophila]